MQVWQRTGMWPSIQQTLANTGTVADCIFTLLQHFNVEESQRFAVTIWSLWKHRNLKLWQDVEETPAQVVDRAFHLIEDWRAANSVTERSSGPNAPIHGWQRPQPGRMKCNIDASFSDSLNRTGIGMCIRDTDGTFVLAKTLHFSPRCSVPLGEAMGLFFAVHWLRDLRLDHVDFALDSQIVTHAFHRQRLDITEFGQLMSATRGLFTSSFTNSRVEFNRRQANEVAHVLARVAPFSASPTIYIDVPHCIEQFIINDML
jgi:ribonuclease HI